MAKLQSMKYIYIYIYGSINKAFYNFLNISTISYN